MNLPRRCGKMYIKFEEKNEPEYGFEFSGNQIKKFISLTDKEIISIILPKLVDSTEFSISSIDEKSPNKSIQYFQKKEMRDYINGRVKICDGCFAGMKKGRIVVPFENSIMLDWGSFDKNACIELVIPKNLTLKQIYRMFDDGFDYEHENWTIIGDKKITGQFGMGGFGCDDYSIMDYNEEDLDHKVANFKISHLVSCDRERKNSKENKEDIME